MSDLNPLPFRLSLPGEDSVKLSGFRSISYNIEGLLHVSDLVVTVEWTGTQTTEQFTFEKVGTDVDKLPIDWVEIPASEISDARVYRYWWSPCLELRSRRLDTFDDIPSARSAILRLKINRRDRAHARDMAIAINEASADAALVDAEEFTRLEPAEDWESAP